MVSIPDCPSGDRGSIPRLRKLFLIKFAKSDLVRLQISSKNFPNRVKFFDEIRLIGFGSLTILVRLQRDNLDK